ncbi:MAG: hypothetical protein ACYDAD_11680 [Acidimicrobiales bacterium]
MADLVLCGRPTQRGKGPPCRAVVVRGCTVCVKHGGKAPQVKAAGLRRLQLAKARKVVARLGLPIEVEPLDALLHSLWEAAGHADWLRRAVEGLDDLTQYGGPTTGRQRHVLHELWSEERDRRARLAGECLKLGIEERRVRMAEVTGERLFAAMQRAAASIGLDHDSQEAFRLAFADQLRARALV